MKKKNFDWDKMKQYTKEEFETRYLIKGRKFKFLSREGEVLGVYEFVKFVPCQWQDGVAYCDFCPGQLKFKGKKHSDCWMLHGVPVRYIVPVEEFEIELEEELFEI